MAQQYETGHAKNVANLQKLIEQLPIQIIIQVLII